MSGGFQKTATIEAELRKAGIATGDTTRRWQLANAIVQTHEYFGQDQAGRLRAHMARDYVGLAADEALEDALLSGKWVEIDREMRAVERQAPPDPNAKREDSHLRHVTESNPYGWARPEQSRGQMDHDIPGRWNTFRQCTNMTAEERARYAARDHRIRGCTRWEVVGKDGNPRVQFDAMEVAGALAKELGEVTAATGEREVYGARQ